MTTLAFPMANQENLKIISTFQKESKRLLNFIKVRVPTTEDAEDILQDVMYEFVNSFRVMRPVEQVASWLFTVARNRITDFYRKKRPSLLEDQSVHYKEDGESFSMADLISSKERNADSVILNDMILEKFTIALNQLPEEQKEVFILHELEDKSFQEIANLTGEKVNTLLSRKRYAVIFLRAELKELYTEIFKN